MLALAPLTPHYFRLTWRITLSFQSRVRHYKWRDASRNESSPIHRQRGLSSFRDLGPDDARKAGVRKHSNQKEALRAWTRIHSLLGELRPDKHQSAAKCSGGHGEDGHSKSQLSQLSLFEELFPDEVYRLDKNITVTEEKEQKLPRIPLPNIPEMSSDSQVHPRQQSQITRAASTNSTHRQQLAVIVLQTASKSLVESDFRRIAPKGRHINEWTGPGDISNGL